MPPQQRNPTQGQGTIRNQPTASRRSERARTQVTTPPSGEQFDLNVSGSESDDNAPPPAPSGGGQAADAPTIIPELNTVNDPTVQTGSTKGAADVHYFFEKVGKSYVCKECR